MSNDRMHHRGGAEGRGGMFGVGARHALPLRYLIVTTAFFSFLSGCGEFWDSPKDAEVSYEVSRKMSDALAENLVNLDAKNLFALLDPGYHTIVANEKELEKYLEQFVERFGNLKEYHYRHNETARRVDGTLNRPSRIFWYKVATTKYALGEYFLKVEVIPAPYGGGLNVSGFGLMAFEKLPNFLQ